MNEVFKKFPFNLEAIFEYTKRTETCMFCGGVAELTFTKGGYACRDNDCKFEIYNSYNGFLYFALDEHTFCYDPSVSLDLMMEQGGAESSVMVSAQYVKTMEELLTLAESMIQSLLFL